MKSFGRRTKIDQYDLKGNFLRSWLSIKEAAFSLGFTPQTISNNLRGIRKSAHGFIWKYFVEDDLNDEFWIEYPLNVSEFQVKAELKPPRERLPRVTSSVGIDGSEQVGLVYQFIEWLL